jgi:membrane fusion protein, multidrug efflux system
MKKTATVFVIALLLASCGGNESQIDRIKKQLNKKEAQVSQLKQEIESLKKELEILDPSLVSERPEMVTVLDVEKNEFRRFVEAQGTTFAENNVRLTTDLGGLVTRVNVETGQYVQQGTVLIELDNSIIKNQIAELQTALRLAKDVYEKRERLWQQNIGSEIEYLQAKNNYESLTASLATANTQLGKTQLRAPISGYVDNIMVRLGEMASPGALAIQLVNLNKMEVRADLAEIHLKSVKVGDIVRVEIPVLGIEKTAKVTSVGKTINQINRTFQVIAIVNNEDGAIKPNLMAKIKVNDLTIDTAVVIPAKLLQESSKGYFVYLAEEDEAGKLRARRRDIEIGPAYESKMVVASGLKGGEKIIDLGYRNVLEGQLLEVKNNN